MNIFFLHCILKIDKEITEFGKTEIGRRKLIHHENILLFKDVDIDKTQVSTMVSSGEINS